MSQRWRGILFILLLVAGSCGLTWSSQAEKTVTPLPLSTNVPKLAVVLVFDQMRGDYLSKWRPLFGEGGFKRLQEEGAWFTNCHYPYAITLTSAGHASLLTGCTPRQHGIIANEWFDRRLGKEVESTDQPRGPGPQRRKQPTVGDVLLQRTRGRGKVVSLSLKPRSAILLAAFRAQICYWFSSLGFFQTSDHYRPGPHRWVTEFNRSKQINTWLGQPWTRCQPELDYAQFSGPDDVPFEGNGYKQGRTFPHPTPDVEALTNSPFGNELLLALARTAIVAEKLGQSNDTDLLCLSFSSNDLVGHCYGPDSQEVLDITLRSDRIVRDLLTFLDQRVGKGNYVVALSADHGVCPIVEVARSHGQNTGYVSPTLLSNKAENFLQKKFASPEAPRYPWIEKVSGPWIYLNKKTLRSLNLPTPQVEKKLADWLGLQEGVRAAFTRTQLSSDDTLPDPMAEMVRQSFDSQASGDVVVILQPFHLLGTPLSSGKVKEYATTHGSPYPYDTHVPLLVMGPGIKPGDYDQKVAPQIMAAILAHVLGMEPPEGARFWPPEELWQK